MLLALGGTGMAPASVPYQTHWSLSLSWLIPAAPGVPNLLLDLSLPAGLSRRNSRNSMLALEKERLLLKEPFSVCSCSTLWGTGWNKGSLKVPSSSNHSKIPWFHDSGIPWFYDFVILWFHNSMILWCNYSLILWFHYSMISLFHNSITPLFHYYLILWFHDFMIPWGCDSNVLRFYNSIILQFHDFIALWFHDSMNSWFRDLMTCILPFSWIQELLGQVGFYILGNCAIFLHFKGWWELHWQQPGKPGTTWVFCLHLSFLSPCPWKFGSFEWVTQLMDVNSSPCHTVLFYTKPWTPPLVPKPQGLPDSRTIPLPKCAL